MNHASKLLRSQQLNWNAHSQDMDDRVSEREDAVRVCD